MTTVHAPARQERFRVIIFCRYPVKGCAKTRLIPALGQAGAAAMHQALAEHTIVRMLRATAEPNRSLEICFTGGSLAAMNAWVCPIVEAANMSQRAGDYPHLIDQGEGNLGQRLGRALRRTCADGLSGAILIGTDALDLDGRHIDGAVKALMRPCATYRGVIGPASDGGYYLIGLEAPHSGLFDDISWGSSDVLRQTLTRAHRLGVEITQLETLDDLDRPDDLAHLLGHKDFLLPTNYLSGLGSVDLGGSLERWRSARQTCANSGDPSK